MAENSIRERLIEADKALIESLGIFKTVERVRLTHSDLPDFAQTQFPVAAIVGSLPVPAEHADKRTSSREIFPMDLQVQIIVYLHIRKDFDTLISSVADDLWRILWTDQTRGKLAYELKVTPAQPIHLFSPFSGFQFLVNHLYQTTIGGI